MDSTNPSPAFSGNDLTHLVLSDFKALSQLCLVKSARKLSDLSDIFFRKPLAPETHCWPSPLFYSVYHIVLVRSKKQMIGIATRGIIAVVQNVKSFWNFTMGKLVSNSVRRCVMAVLFIFSVAKGKPRFCPRPALIVRSLFHVPPKPFLICGFARPPRFCAELAALNVALFASHGGNILK